MTDRNVAVSVVILTNNSEDTVKLCLDMLEEQSCNGFEVVVVDNNSKDNTLNIVNNSSLNPKLFIERSNIPKARNIGIKHSCGEYIAFIDSDAYADKDWIKEIIKTFSSDKNIGLIGGKELPVHFNEFSYALSLIDDTMTSLTSPLWRIRTCNFIIRKSIIEKVGHFDESWPYHEDSDFVHRIKKSPYNFVYDEKIKVSHVRRTSPLAFFKQQFKYAMWRLKFSFQKKEFRFIDYIPSLLLLTLIFAPLNRYLLIFFISVIFAESFFVLLHSKEKLKYLPYIFIGWMIKNIGWGFGIYMGIYDFFKNVNK